MAAQSNEIESLRRQLSANNPLLYEAADELDRQKAEIESLRQQLKLSSQREIKLSQCISRDQHNYASLQTAFNEMKALAAERLKQIVMLRDLIPKRIPGGFLSFGKYCCEDESLFNPSYRAMTPHKKRYLSDCEEALAATDDLENVRLCEKEPVAWMGHEYCVGYQHAPNDTPLYRAWEPK